jgi:hypothetical protein
VLGLRYCYLVRKKPIQLDKSSFMKDIDERSGRLTLRTRDPSAA